MKYIFRKYCCKGPVFRLWTFMMLTIFFSFFVAQYCSAASRQVPSGTGDMDAMMEEDNLQLGGLVLNNRLWQEKDDGLFNSEIFEPQVLQVKVRTQAGNCLGLHEFYIKKGIDVNMVKKGDIVEFKINKNMCHPRKALIIVELTLIESTNRK